MRIGSVSLEPPEHARALIFDCDGTLVDTMGLHRICWHRILARHGFDITDEWWEEWAPHPVAPMVLDAVPDASPELIAEMADEGNRLFLDQLHLLEPLEHVVEIARAHHGRLPLAVVSGGFRDPVVRSLETVGILGMFDHVITAEDVAATKPAPDGYLLAIERLGVPAGSCVVYEDTTVGMDAARAAGIVDIRDVR